MISLGVGEDSSAFVLKLFLDKEDLERLYDFEEECMEGLVREKELKLKQSTDERVRNIGRRMEEIESKLEDALKRTCEQNESIQKLSYRLMKLETIPDDITETLEAVQRWVDLRRQESPVQSPVMDSADVASDRKTRIKFVYLLI